MITEAQEKFRKGKVGASDAGAILGVSPWETQAEAWARISGFIPPKEKSPAMDIGNAIEPFIAQAYMRQTGEEITPYTQTLIHPKYDWMICHPDYRKSDGTIIEIKNVGPRMWNHWGEDGDPDGAPLYVVAQCAIQAIIDGTEWTEVCAYFGGDDLRIYPTKISKHNKEIIEEKIVSFWNEYIATAVQPPMTAEDMDLIKKLYPYHLPGVGVDCPAELMPILENWRESKAQAKILEERIKTAGVAIREAFGMAEFMLCGDELELTYRVSRDREVVDWKAIVLEANPPLELIERHTTYKAGNRSLLDKRKA